MSAAARFLRERAVPLGGREHSMGKITPIRPDIHLPLLTDRSDEPVRLFDQSTEPVSGCVVLNQVERRAMASMLSQCRPHLASPQACDEAILLLTGDVG